MKYYLLLLILWWSVVIIDVNCQNSIELKAYWTSDSVMLRWAPKNYEIWQQGIKSGYKIDRVLVGKEGTVVNENQITSLHDGVILPFAESKWESVVLKDSVFAPPALQALWGETFELTSTFKNNMMESYNKVKENELRFGFSLYCADRSVIVANAMGVFFVDKSIRPNESYLYRVYMNSSELKVNTDTAYLFVDPSRPPSLFIPQQPDAIPNSDKVLINWRCNGNDYVGYIVEKSLDGKKYNKVSNDLIIPFANDNIMMAYYADTLSAMYNRCYYRVAGITPFGIRGPYSEPLQVNLSLGLQPPVNAKATVDLEGLVNVTWNYETEVSHLNHFEILRSSLATGVYEFIGRTKDSKKREWRDLHPLGSGYYKVVAVSDLGVRAESLETFAQLNDSVPPAIPIGLVGEVDSTGVVTLNWMPNKEFDLFGYRVFRANNILGEYVQLSHSIIQNAQFTDTISINTLTKDVVYKLAAVDKRYNSSDFSNPLVLKRPDKVSPAPPVLLSLDNVADGVNVSWIKSPSDDVQYQLLYRANERDTLLLQKCNNQISSFKDTTLISGRIYSYGLIAVDSAANRSIVRNWQNVIGKEKKIMHLLELSVEPKDNFIILKWVNNLEGNNQIIVYRKQASSFSILATLSDSNIIEFKDTTVEQGNEYSYFIRVSQSVSNTVKISY